MKILITGGKGFIARSLFEGLSVEHSVLSPGSKELNLLDSRKVFNCIKNGKFDLIIHTATYDAVPKHSAKDASKVLINNLKMFFNLARCGDYFQRMLYFGTGAEFGREHWIPEMKEEYFDQYMPADQYGFSKYVMNKYAHSASNIYNFRLFGVFGKYDDWRYRFISNACCRAIFNQEIVINQNVFFDYLYINDLVRIVKWFIKNRPQKKTYNICTGKIYDLVTLARKINKISANKVNIVIKNENLNKEYSGDNTRLLNELGNFKFSLMDEALCELYNWYSLNKHLIQRDKL